MFWGTVGGNGKCYEDILSPLGLVSHGGSINPKNEKMTYIISSEENDFTCEIDWGDLESVHEIYNMYLRKKKLENVTNRKSS